MDLLFHMLLPAMLAMIAGIDRRRAIAIMPFAILPDLDALLFAHHLIFHSLILISLAAFAGLLCCRLVTPSHLGAGVLASLYVYSHIVLDLLTDGDVGLFWPLSNIGYSMSISLTVTHQSLWPRFGLVMALGQHLLPNSSAIVDASAISGGGVALLLLLLLTMTYELRSLRHCFKILVAPSTLQKRIITLRNIFDLSGYRGLKFLGTNQSFGMQTLAPVKQKHNILVLNNPIDGNRGA
jgi:membrane-bound metal-dependent hydrolase YbcI (DUF457 family)